MHSTPTSIGRKHLQLAGRWWSGFVLGGVMAYLDTLSGGESFGG
jgi:hypothetical protein